MGPEDNPRDDIPPNQDHHIRADRVVDDVMRLWRDNPAQTLSLDKQDREIIIKALERHREDIESLRNDIWLTALCEIENGE